MSFKSRILLELNHGRKLMLEANNNTFAMLSFLLVMGILGVRCILPLVFPVLHYEDGTDMLSFYNLNSGFDNVFRFYAGYISLLPNIIGWFSIFLPVHWVPYFFAFTSLIIAAFAYSIFTWPGFSGIEENRLVRLAVCIILAALPIGNFALFTVVAYSLWHLLLILILLTFAPLPKSQPFRIIQYLVMVLLICSNPVSVICVPFWLYFVVVGRGNRVFYIGLVITYFVYFIFAVRSQSVGDFGLESIMLSLHYVLQRVLPEAFLGAHIRLFLYDTEMLINYLLSLALISLFVFLRATKGMHNNPMNAKFLATLGILVGGLTLLSVHGRQMSWDSHMTLYQTRYFYLQQVIVASAFLMLLVPIYKSSSLLCRQGLLLLLLFVLISNSLLFTSSISMNRTVMTFLRQFQERLHSADCEEDEYAVLPRDGRWKIVLRYRDCDASRFKRSDIPIPGA